MENIACCHIERDKSSLPWALGAAKNRHICTLLLKSFLIFATSMGRGWRRRQRHVCRRLKAAVACAPWLIGWLARNALRPKDVYGQWVGGRIPLHPSILRLTLEKKNLEKLSFLSQESVKSQKSISAAAAAEAQQGLQQDVYRHFQQQTPQELVRRRDQERNRTVRPPMTSSLHYTQQTAFNFWKY